MTAVVEHLKDIAQFYSDAGEGFKAAAFVKAAVAISKRPPLQFKSGKLQDKIPGVGKSIQTVIEEFTANGTSSKFKQLAADVKPKVTGKVHYMQETTDNWNTEYRVPCHIYLLQNARCIGYIREGTDEIQMFKKPSNFDKRGRKFKELSKTAIEKAGFVEVKP
jgi:hypothetical protein